MKIFIVQDTEGHIHISDKRENLPTVIVRSTMMEFTNRGWERKVFIKIEGDRE